MSGQDGVRKSPFRDRQSSRSEAGSCVGGHEQVFVSIRRGSNGMNLRHKEELGL